MPVANTDIGGAMINSVANLMRLDALHIDAVFNTIPSAILIYVYKYIYNEIRNQNESI